MAIDTGKVEITRWAIHEIPKTFSKHEGLTPNLSEAESPPDDDVARFFERRISDSFKISKHQIQPLDEASETPAAIREHLLNDSQDLIGLSKTLAEKLFEAQSGAMSPGLLVVLHGKHEEASILCVLKLEKEEGARAETTEIEGMATYNVEYMRDLFLTGRTRVFKIALFLLDEAALEGWVSDLQARGPDIADFFLTTFLGCRLTSDPSVVTRTFHLAAEKFINEIVSDPETKVRYETALLAQLNSNDKEISLNTFANKYLDTKDRAPFVKDLAAAGVTTSFVKDTQLISKKLRKLQYEFSQGVKVTYPADIPEDVVHVSAQTDGRTAMKIVDELKNLHTRT